MKVRSAKRTNASKPKTVSVVFDSALWREVKSRAKKLNRSASGHLRQLVADDIAGQEAA